MLIQNHVQFKFAFSVPMYWRRSMRANNHYFHWVFARL